MSEELSRRDFLKLAGLTAASLIAGQEDSALAKSKKLAQKNLEVKKEEKEEVKFGRDGFLTKEIESLIGGLENKLRRQFLHSELKRVQELEAKKTMERRFGKSQLQLEKYLIPFLNNHDKIFKAVDEIDSQKQVPREVILGLIGMEGGGRVAENPQSGAAGLYQLTKETARALGLRVDEKKDERYLLEPSTKAMLGYLRQLFERFGRQWGLALMAYSGGPTKLERRIRENFDLSDKDKFTPELFKSRCINSVTLYSKHFKGLGKFHSVQYPFGAQFMAEKMKNLIKKGKYENAYLGG